MNKNIERIKPFFKFVFSNDFLLKIIYILIIISLFNLIAGNLEINTYTYIRGHIDNQLDGDVDIDGDINVDGTIYNW
ncbi:MAG TPA: hypothetical protein PKU93_01020 [Candidatus Pacearchaeota archaeon]|nr:hypothetical protein [Candidatus Pacearchaeota archaeon]